MVHIRITGDQREIETTAALIGTVVHVDHAETCYPDREHSPTGIVDLDITLPRHLSGTPA